MRPFCAIAVLLLLAVSGGGCVARPAVKEPYAGPTEPMDAVIARINQRNGRIDKLRGEGTFRARLVEADTGRVSNVDGDIQALYMPRRNLRLIGKVVTERVFDIGSNDDRFWFIFRDQTMWWGSHRLIGGRRLNQLPVRPDLLAEVLSVGPIETDLLKEPVPVMRFNNDQDTYMFTWQVQLPDRWVVQKEVWYDRATLQPKLVLLFDENGRIVLRAYLQRPAPVGEYEPPVEIAGVYDMYFPENGSTFRIDFYEWKRQNRGAPRPTTFNFPADADVETVVPLDD